MSEHTIELGRLIRRTRVAAGWSIEEMRMRAGISHVTWRRLESGATVKEITYGKVEQAFRWAAGSIELFLRDGTTPARADTLVIYAVVLTPFDPPEIAGLYTNQAAAEQHRELLRDRWTVEQWRVSDSFPPKQPRS